MKHPLLVWSLSLWSLYILIDSSSKLICTLLSYSAFSSSQNKFLGKVSNSHSFAIFAISDYLKGEGNKMIADEKILLRQLKEGSHQAFQRLLWILFRFCFYGFIFRLTRSHGLTTEVVQIAFSKVWNSHTRIVPEESFKAWLFKIGKMKWSMTMKKTVE